MATCGTMIEGNVVAFACDLDSGHDGPHRAYENARSVRERTRWEADQRHDQSGLAQFQGRAQTTAEAYTEGATEPPVAAPAAPPASPPTTEGVWSGIPVVKPQAQAPAEDAPETPVEPTKQREGDQPLPQPTGDEFVQDRIIAKVQALRAQGGLTSEQAEHLIRSMEESKATGMQRYGSALQTFNGRDCLQDAAEEARDLYVYLNSLVQARETQRAGLVDVVAQAIRAADGDHTMGAGALAEVAVDAILKATGPLGDSSP